jgi:DNA-binding response OmpR family regulator
MHSYKILVIEDDTDITNLLRVNLRSMGHEVTMAHDGNEGLELSSYDRFDLIILDIMLPGIDGLEICRRIRSKENYTPIMMLTCKSSEFDRVLGLEIGADDYITKPFSIKELLARVKALFRRLEALKSSPEPDKKKNIRRDDLFINAEKRKVTLKGKSIHLTAKEFDLLYHFTLHPGRVYTRSQLLDSVWGYGYDGYEHTVSSHINRLRAKLERTPAHPEYILTVSGVGYKFTEGSEDDE